MTLTPSLSAYLDLLRFIAAFAVLLGHMDQDGLSMAWMPLSNFSHDAVVVFFVLSGFIIHFSTASRSSTWQQYAVARVSRIYSVALPSVLFCVALAMWLAWQPGFDPSRFSNFTRPSWTQVASSLLFLNESWLNQSDVPLNNPYWSLCYEVWYYVIFGLFYFSNGRRRWLFAGAAGVVAGPAILVLLPVWLMGAWLAASRRHETRWSTGLAWLAFVLPLCLIALIKATDADRAVRLALHHAIPGFWRLDSSQRFVTDYVIGAALCLHISSFSSLPVSIQAFFSRHRSPLAALAGFSFTLYLFHRPMTQLIGASWPQGPDDVLTTALLALGFLVACWVVSWGTEKQLPRWRRGFSRLLLPSQSKAIP